VRLYRGGSELLTITNHHGRYAGISVWQQGVLVTDPVRWLGWFSSHGMSEPRREYDAEIETEKQSRLFYARRVAAAPVHARPFLTQKQDVDINGLREAIANQFPDRRERILALLAGLAPERGPGRDFPATSQFRKTSSWSCPHLTSSARPHPGL
jgi:hypothetical protein